MRFFVFLFLSSLAVAAKAPPLPKWSAEDKERLKSGEIVVGVGLLTDVLAKKQEETEVEVIIEAVQAKPNLPGTETLSSEAVVSASYLEKYFGGAQAKGLIDPQQLLSMQERADLKYALEEHEQASGLPIYLYLFDDKQSLPEGYAPEEVYAKSFSENKVPLVLVYYFMGAPERSEFLLAGGVSDEVPEWQVRELLWNSTHKAREQSEVFDQLSSFVGQLSMRLFWVEEILSELRVQPVEEDRAEKEIAPSNGKVDVLREVWESEVKPHGVRIALWAGGILLVGGGFVYVVLMRRYRFPESPSPARLGGMVGGKSGGVLRYRDARVPPTMQRKQFEKDFL